MLKLIHLPLQLPNKRLAVIPSRRRWSVSEMEDLLHSSLEIWLLKLLVSTSAWIQINFCRLNLMVRKIPNPLRMLESKVRDFLDQILISRNPAGRVAPALEQIMLFDVFLNLTSVVVIHHTGILHSLSSGQETITKSHPNCRLWCHPFQRRGHSCCP
jgi:hypothetical protein